MAKCIDDFELVCLLKAHPILYDKSLARGRRYTKQKDDAWRLVASHIGFSERACITRWKSIRDRFGKEYRRMQEHPEETTTWKLFPHIMFLKNHYKHGNAKTDEIVVKYVPKISKNKRFTNKLKDSDIDPEELSLNQHLISLVRNYPVLYHKQYIRDSKNLMAKNDAWNKISEILCISEEDAYKRWKKLRDRFAREYRYHKIHPEKPITWLYFSELEFLEDHYRKGVPLPFERTRRKNIVEQTATNHVDSSVEETYDVCGDLILSDNAITDSVDTIDRSMDFNPSFEELEHMQFNSSTTENLTIFPLQTSNSVPEQQLGNVISNMEILLKQTKDCLNNLKQQNANQCLEPTLTVETSAQPLLVRRMEVLLEGLSSEQRKVAKCKIYKFLCECQMKSANNEIIDDII